MRAEIHQIVTFADEVFKGNPAFVVSLPRDASDAILQALAGQLGEPVLASLRPADGRLTGLHFHSPEGRHVGAGHAMMAAAHVGFDRMLGYGLKYASAFNETHLGRIGRVQAGA